MTRKESIFSIPILDRPDQTFHFFSPFIFCIALALFRKFFLVGKIVEKRKKRRKNIIVKRNRDETIEEFFSSCWSEDRTIERLSPRKESEKEAKWEMARETVKNKGKKGRTEIHR